jgi:murein DD-endopeptidase MepM/ murein hydrolase activator NlpD
MTDHFTQNPIQKSDDEVEEHNTDDVSINISNIWQRLWQKLLMLGLGESALRAITGGLAIVLVLVVVWVMNAYFIKGKQNSPDLPLVSLTAQVTVVSGTANPEISTDYSESSFGISRLAQLYTNLPSHPRDKVITYTVQTGDTIFGIADKFGLTPESILWCNRYVLGNVPENLMPGVEINIPPENGVIYQWMAGSGLNGVAEFYHVTPDVIIDWPSNNLNRATLGDLSLPNIPEGTMLFIPGGTGESTDWLPEITRDTPAVSSSFGEGFCGVITEGAIGNGTFAWPTSATYLSGYDYSSVHHGIDIAGEIGNPIYASDSGVVVYEGWNNSGYGNLVILDHGSGWQTVYGHLNEIYVDCGQSVYQGDIIAGLGTTGNSTGPHLHFEIRKNAGYVNPWDLLITP